MDALNIMQYSFDSPNAYTKILKVSVGKRRLRASILEAEKYLSASLSVRGFRKGKVPLEIARKHLDKKAVLEQALERAVKRSFADVLAKETGIELIEASHFILLC